MTVRSVIHQMTDMSTRFIESLTARVHNTPPSIERLSDIFQEFYVKAETNIATHISALSTRQFRGVFPNASISSRGSITTRDGKIIRSQPSKDTLGSQNGSTPEQQMLTPKEISDRRKARRLLDRKGIALEEAVERRVCERIYNRIWRHRTTLDEVRDEKLRSRTAALALVGIGLQDLGITLDSKANGDNHAAVAMEIEDWISKARDGLLRMNDAKYPLGKLQQLAAAHKSIVDLLTSLHQSSSSADEILPTLIYTLITTPSEGINVISNLHFIQRFRAASKVDGEAAYCLTNLEAAITFLETVDLASLRSDESLEGPPKSSSRPTTPRTEIGPDWTPGTPTSAFLSTASATPATAASTQLSPSHSSQALGLAKHTMPGPPSHQRRLSNLLQPPVTAFGVAGDAVRTTADQGFKTIGNTLDSSFKLLFGRLREQKVTGDAVDKDGTIIVPKTLDDARKLVGPKPTDEDEIPISRTSSIAEARDDSHSIGTKSDDSLLNIIAGRKQSRDRSVDSAQSSGSGKKVAFAGDSSGLRDQAGLIDPLSTAPHEQVIAGNGAVESIRNLGNSLNPLKGFGGMSVMRGFGRSSSSGTPTPNPALVAAVSNEKPSQQLQEPSDFSRDTHGDHGHASRISPPLPRFMAVGSAGDLKIGEVNELLHDYRRLAGVLNKMGAF